MRRPTLLVCLSGLALLAAGCDTRGPRVEARVQLTVAALNVAESNSPPATAIPCADEATYCSPSNLSGRIYADDNNHAGGTIAFSLIDGEIMTSVYEGVDGGAEARELTRLEFNYDYLDATLAMGGPLAGGGPAATYHVRTVFVTDAVADDVTGTMHRGDKLVLPPGAERWQGCNAAGCSEDRAAVADGLITEAKLVDYQHPGQGPIHYIPFTVPLEPVLQLRASEINTPGSLWSCAFHMADAVRMNQPPSSLTTPQALIGAFELAYEPDREHAGQEVTISARLDFEQGPGAAEPPEGEPDSDPTVVEEPIETVEVSPSCQTLCARVASCRGFGDEAFGASEAECGAGCSGQPEAVVATVLACVSDAPCNDGAAFAACLPAP